MAPTHTAAASALSRLISRRRGEKDSITKPIRKKKPKKAQKDSYTAGAEDADLDLDPAERAQREAEKQRKVEEAVKVLKRNAVIKDREREARKRILEMREKKLGKKGKRRRAIEEPEDSD